MGKHSLQVMTSSKGIEWYTPPDLLEEVTRFYGAIDLDPACPEVENGLMQTWRGKVFLNPPYGRCIKQWIDRAMTDPVDEIILLVPASTGVQWFQPLWQHTLCFVTGRLRFSWKEAAPFNSVLVYRGHRPEAFKAAFEHRGHVVVGAPAKPQIYQLPLEVA
jgi:hypothetical protein